jgi:hypothetical protein
MWWVNYTAAHLADYQVPWAEFHNAFLTCMMRRKYHEFMDLKQDGRSIHDYSKLFNNLAQYALDQVNTDEKKKNHFMTGLSMKL